MMDFDELKQQPELMLKPSAIYAFLQIAPLLCLSVLFLWIACNLFGAFAWISLALILFAAYRFLFIRKISCLINHNVIRVSTGLFFTRLDSLEMYHIKDYVIVQPFPLRLLKLMNLTLKTTGPGNKSVTFKGIPVSDIIGTIREHVQKARPGNHIVELN